MRGTHLQVNAGPLSLLTTREVAVIHTTHLPVRIRHDDVSPTTPAQCASPLAERTASGGAHASLEAREPRMLLPGVVGRSPPSRPPMNDFPAGDPVDSLPDVALLATLPLLLPRLAIERAVALD